MHHLAELQGVRPLMVPELGREVSPLNDLAAVGRLLRLIRGARPQIVHTHLAKAGTTARLAATGLNAEFLRVDTAEAMEAALDSGSWDAVLSDYNLPGFSALDALDILHRRRLIYS